MKDYPPPAYFNSRSQAVAGPSERELPPIPAVPDTVKPINLLSVSRPNGSIKGTYVIDPDIKIPQSLLPPLAADETEATRRNAYFHAKNGSIKVDIFIVGDADSKHPADILIDSSNGSIKTKLVRSSIRT
jgi:hypothetical protein